MTTDPDERDEDLKTALAAYRRRIENLRAQAREVDAQIAKAEAIARMIEDEMFGPMGAVDRVDPPTLSSTSEPVKALNNGELVVKLAKKILLNAGRPLSRQEILANISKLGYTLNVANPPKFVGKTLWAHKDFVHVDQQGYWLASKMPAEKGDNDQNS
ncbi:hypothetical protein [Rhizobium leguminosarum]|uniref:hypothetical protein n=1 Tax=Rhizobium leguminosarum TaxID=384 RepID=UPI002FF09F07